MCLAVLYIDTLNVGLNPVVQVNNTTNLTNLGSSVHSIRNGACHEFLNPLRKVTGTFLLPQDY